MRERWEAYEGEGGLLPDALQHLLQGQGVNPILRQRGKKVESVSSRARQRMEDSWLRLCLLVPIPHMTHLLGLVPKILFQGVWRQVGQAELEVGPKILINIHTRA